MSTQPLQRSERIDIPTFFLDEEQWKAFTAALDAPASAMPRLEKLLREPSVLEL